MKGGEKKKLIFVVDNMQKGRNIIKPCRNVSKLYFAAKTNIKENIQVKQIDYVTLHEML